MNSSSSWEVSFYDLFMYILQRWRMLLVFLIVGAVLVGGIGVLRSAGPTVETEKTSEEEKDKWSVGLTQEQKQSVEIIASQIQYREKMIRGVKDFIDNSYYMELDPFHMFTCTMYYSVLPEQEESKPYELASLAISYVSALNDTQTRREIEDVLDPENHRNDAEGVLGQDNARIVNTAAADKEFGIFMIVIYANSQEDQDAIVQKIQDIVSGKQDEITSNLGAHTLTLLGIDQSTEYNESVRSNQIVIVQTVKTLDEQLTAMKAAVSGAEEKQYLEYLLHGAETDSKIEETIKDEEQSSAQKTETKTTFLSRIRSNLKKAVIGALLGLVICVILLIIRYVTAGKIRRTADLEKCINTRVIARFDGDTAFIRKHHSVLDKWLRRKRNKNQQVLPYQENIEAAAASIELIAARNGKKKITFLSADAKIDKLVEDINNAYTGEIEMNVINNLFSSADGISQLQNTDGVILAAETDVTSLKEINNLLGICYQCNIPVIGSLILE